MKRILLLRHFPTSFNDEGKIMADKYDLDSLPIDSSYITDSMYSDIASCQIAYCSPAKRACNTALQLFKCDVMIDDRISPREIGDWAGLTLKDISRIAPDAIIKHGDGLHFNLSYEPPGAESNKVLLNRLNSFFEMLYKSQFENIGVVTHSMICCMLLSITNHTASETATIDYQIDFYKTYEILL